MRNDLTGKKFGRLTVVSPTEQRAKDKSIVWLCKCDCGNEVFAGGTNLKTGHIKSCGCARKGKSIAIEKNGLYGYLTALEDTGKRTSRGTAIWKCKCKCGKEVEFTSSTLKMKGLHSCGCARGLNNMKDIKGQRFTRLLAVAPTDERLKGSVVWECKCDCGNTTKASYISLSSGKKKSCGCLVHESKRK